MRHSFDSHAVMAALGSGRHIIAMARRGDAKRRRSRPCNRRWSSCPSGRCGVSVVFDRRAARELIFNISSGVGRPRGNAGLAECERVGLQGFFPLRLLADGANQLRPGCFRTYRFVIEIFTLSPVNSAAVRGRRQFDLRP